MRDSLQVAVETESKIPLAPAPYSTLYWPQPQIEVPLVVKVLLDELTSQWDSLSLVVEEAAKRGLRVVCITGSRPQEGRSTVAKAALPFDWHAEATRYLCSKGFHGRNFYKIVMRMFLRP